MTAGAGHTAGHTEGRRRASGARTRNRQTHGTSHGDGETEGDTTEYSRTQQETHGSHGTHNRQERRTSGRKAGREGGERGADGLAPGEWWRRGTKRTHGSRQGAERERKKEIYKYLRERREKNAAETRKSVQVCAYTYHLISWHSGRILHFLLYI